MNMDAKRSSILKRLSVTHYAVAICVVLIFLQWFMPYFRYEPHDSKDLKTQASLWGEILFPYNFKQLDDVMKDTLNTGGTKVYRFLSLRHLGAPVLMMVCGIIILCTISKKGTFSCLIPLVMSVAGVKGWLFGNLIPTFGNVSLSKLFGIVLIFLLLLSTIAKLVCCIQETRSRPSDYYLPSLE